jgi:hypothetical protein
VASGRTAAVPTKCPHCVARKSRWGGRKGSAGGPYGGNGAFSFVRNEVALIPCWADSIRRNDDYEALVTVGMRGDGDVGMEDAQGTATLAMSGR